MFEVHVGHVVVLCDTASEALQLVDAIGYRHNASNATADASKKLDQAAAVKLDT